MILLHSNPEPRQTRLRVCVCAERPVQATPRDITRPFGNRKTKVSFYFIADLYSLIQLKTIGMRIALAINSSTAVLSSTCLPKGWYRLIITIKTNVTIIDTLNDNATTLLFDRVVVQPRTFTMDCFACPNRKRTNLSISKISAQNDNNTISTISTIRRRGEINTIRIWTATFLSVNLQYACLKKCFPQMVGALISAV